MLKPRRYKRVTPVSAAAANGSGVFNGTTAYLTASHPDMAGTWTVEFFWYPTTITTQQTIISFNGGLSSGINVWCNTSSQLVVDNGLVGQPAFTGSTFTTNTWKHVAIVRNGTTTTGYINGVSVGSNTFTPGTINAVSVGRFNSNPTFFYNSGNLSNVRTVVGTAVYTSNFTPPTAPLTAITNTSLLLLMNATPFVDTSVNAFAITNTGPVTYSSSVSPF
mgnify:CR=1 FL=1